MVVSNKVPFGKNSFKYFSQQRKNSCNREKNLTTEKKILAEIKNTHNSRKTLTARNKFS